MKEKMTAVFTAIILMFICPAAFAEGDVRTYTAAHVDQSWVCSTLVNDEARGVFAALMQDGDRVTGGVQVDVYNREGTSDRLGCWMLMAVRRGEDTLLLAARNGDAFAAAVNFLDADDCEIKEAVSYDWDGKVFHVSPGIYAEGKVWKVIPYAEGIAAIDSFACVIDGGTMELAFGRPENCVEMTVRRGEDVQVTELACEFPKDIAAWTAQTFPDTPEDMEAWAAKHPKE